MRTVNTLVIAIFVYVAAGFSQVSGCLKHRINDWPEPTILDILNAPPCQRNVPILGTVFHIQGGTFTQGSADDPCQGNDETPFTHTLTRDFLAMETEVSRQMWADLKALRPNLPVDPTNTLISSGMDNPVQNVTWPETLLFANLYSLEHGLTPCYYTDDLFLTPLNATNYNDGSYFCKFDAEGFRLPSEAEWEYMTRAGTTTPFSIDVPNYTGEACATAGCTPGTFPVLETVAYYCGNSTSETLPVGSLDPNPWGLKDVHGNVWEWCWDWYDLYPSGAQTDYFGPVNGTLRILRGGNYGIGAEFNRSADRINGTPDFPIASLGFRLIKTYL